MKSEARVVVVGGGVAGLSALYHLTAEGWNDVVLLERNELTSGTTWHSAAQAPSIAFNQLLLLMRDYTIKLYDELASDPEYPINYHRNVGGLRLITDQEQLDGCNHILSVAKGLGFDFELLDPSEVGRRNPLVEEHELLAALWDGRDGDIDPAQLCQALARRCRAAGVEINRNTPATGFEQCSTGEWIIETEKGSITAEHVVIAAGYRANEVGAMLGIEYPVISMEHMYFITDDIPELIGREHDRVAMVRCPRDTFYMRQEGAGLLVGIYEWDCKTFGTDSIDPNFVNALCPPDLERLLPKLEPIMERVPVLGEVGIRSVVNGPIAYAADAGPLVGKQPGFRNLWSMNGIRVGIGEGGGYGKMLAQMIVHGETEWDCWQFDPRRLTDHANTEYTVAKSIEDYQLEFVWHLPHEHRPAGRPAKTSPIYPVLKDKGAEFEVINGWERTSFYKASPDFVEEHTYRFANWHETVAAEVEAVRERVGIAELSGFNQYNITGAGVVEWLDTLTCSRVSATPGRASLCYFLTPSGNISGEATVVPLPDGSVFYGSGAAAEFHDRDWLEERLPAGSDICIESRTNTHTMLLLAGPRARDLLAAVSPRSDWSQAGLAWLRARRCFVGHVEALAIAVSFSGEQAVELHIPNTQLYAAYETVVAAGAQFGLTHFGMYAIDSMRMEKGYGHWKADFISEFNPYEAGLERFVDLSKDFPGKPGLIAQIAAGNRRQRVMLEVDSVAAPAQPGEGVFAGHEPVGVVTSGAWGHRVGKNLAMAYIEPTHAGDGTALTVWLLGQPVDASVAPLCSFDPHNTVPRGVPG
ncbi:MAG: FAD-dependent oxidoreductase [Actinomycetia bacterium]|nr:FAD-dependent oxidoreductase [Actinomycetes bacterium]